MGVQEARKRTKTLLYSTLSTSRVTKRVDLMQTLVFSQLFHSLVEKERMISDVLASLLAVKK